MLNSRVHRYIQRSCIPRPRSVYIGVRIIFQNRVGCRSARARNYYSSLYCPLLEFHQYNNLPPRSFPVFYNTVRSIDITMRVIFNPLDLFLQSINSIALFIPAGAILFLVRKLHIAYRTYMTKVEMRSHNNSNSLC